MNKPVAETMMTNIESIGMPKWTAAAETLAKALQKEMKVAETGMAKTIPPLRGRSEVPDEDKRGGGSDDIGDVSWNGPTITLRHLLTHSAGLADHVYEPEFQEAVAELLVQRASNPDRTFTPEELIAFRHGGILPYVLRQLVGSRQ